MLDQRADETSLMQEQFLQGRAGNSAKSSVSASSSQSMIGKSLIIKGEITGSESIHIEGTVEGLIALPGDRVTVGASGRVSADITAQDIVVFGELTGSSDTSDHLHVRSGGSFCGDIVTARIVVEDGAFLTGTVDIRREAPPVAEAPEPEITEEEFAELAQAN